MKQLLVSMLGMIALQLTISCNDVPKNSEMIFQVYRDHADSILESKIGFIDSAFYLFKKTKYTSAFIHENQKLKKIEGFLLNNSYGHQFLFTNDGKLSTYSFNVGNSLYNSRYIELRGDQYIEGGTDFTDYFEMGDDFLIPGKKKIDFFFSTFPRKNVNVFISHDGNNYRPVEINDSQLMPFLKELEIEVDVLKTQKIYFEIKSSDLFIELKGLTSTKSNFDTVFLKN